jgi:hypothetical protein
MAALTEPKTEADHAQMTPMHCGMCGYDWCGKPGDACPSCDEPGLVLSLSAREMQREVTREWLRRKWAMTIEYECRASIAAAERALYDVEAECRRAWLEAEYRYHESRVFGSLAVTPFPLTGMPSRRLREETEAMAAQQGYWDRVADLRMQVPSRDIGKSRWSL